MAEAKALRTAARASAVLAVLGLLVTGCAQTPMPVERYFRLEAKSPEPFAAPPLHGALVVKRFAAEALLSQRAIVYADAEALQPLYQYHHHFWADAPTAMLQQVTATALREAGVAMEVVTPADGVVAENTLSGRIVHLEHLLGEPPMVAVELEIAVLNDARRELLLLRSYRFELAVDEPGVAAAVAAMNDALTRIMASLVSDLRRS